jgi:hypothetical protein
LKKEKSLLEQVVLSRFISIWLLGAFCLAS